MRTTFPKTFVYVLRTATTRHMVSFIDFYRHFLAANFSHLNFASYVLYIHLTVLRHVSHKVSLSYLWKYLASIHSLEFSWTCPGFHTPTSNPHTSCWSVRKKNCCRTFNAALARVTDIYGRSPWAPDMVIIFSEQKKITNYSGRFFLMSNYLTQFRFCNFFEIKYTPEKDTKV